MKTSFFSYALFLGLALELFSGLAVSDSKLYKWVDDKGNTFFSDQVQPEDNKYQLEKLDKKGSVVEVIEKPKTPEERAQEKRMTALRKEQEKLIEDSKIHDKSLLATYQTKEDLIKSQNRKKQSLEGKVKMFEAELKIHTEELRKLQVSAADLERNAKKIPKDMLEQIKKAKDQIAQSKTDVTHSIATMKQANDGFDADVKRFVALTQSDQPVEEVKLPSIEEANSLGLFRCENDQQCNQAWEFARTFVNTFSSTPPDITTDKLIMTGPPTEDTDFSLSISKVADANKNDQLFLDIHCRDSSAGKELCASQKAQELRTTFQPYVNERLRSKVPTP